LWAIDQINNYDISQRYELLTQETDFLNNWIRHHTSDHCAINHLHQINKRMGILLQFNNLSISNQQQLFNSFNENTKLLNDRPGSESIWYSRRSIVSILLDNLKLPNNYEKSISRNSNQTDLNNSKISQSESSLLSTQLINLQLLLSYQSSSFDINELNSVSNWYQSEIDLCYELSGRTGKAVMWNEEKQLLYSDRYIAWLHFKV
jgi:hypothetical protein